MRFAIYGSGGLGGYYGARLSEAGHDVGFIARGAHLDAINQDGLQVKSPAGDLHLKDVNASANPADIGEVDAVLVAVKTWQVREVAQAMKPLVGESTTVVPFLNGVTASDEIADVLGAKPVLGGLSKIFSLIEGPGVIRHLNANAYVEIGELNGKPSDRTQKLVDEFKAAGVDAVVSDDIRTELWKKLMLVSSWSGIATLSRSPLGVIRSQPETRALVDRCIDEGFAVGRAKGLQLEDSFRADMWSFYDSLPHEMTSSMMRDMLEEKPSELDAWIGAIVEQGRQVGVETPVSQMSWNLLTQMERKARGVED